MGAADLIEQSSDGTIITGLRGESIVRSHDFYVAFVVNEEYRVSHSGHHVGNIAADTTPQTDDYLILAGRRWKILEIDQERKSIEVRPAPGGRVPSFHSHQGKDIHPRVRLMMRSLLGRTDLQIYLDPQARDMIVQARATARDSGFLQNTFLQDGPDTVWFTWTGSRIQRTLGALGQFFGGLKVEDEGVALVFEKATVLHVQETYRRLLAECPQPVDLAVQFASRVQEKYELYLSDELTAEIFARERLDLPGAKALISASCCHETAHHQPRTTARHDTVP
jgi:ATP-dependent Lhr-like helicase